MKAGKALAGAPNAPPCGSGTAMLGCRLNETDAALTRTAALAIIRLVGAILVEQNDEWAVQKTRYMTLGTIVPISDNPIVMLAAVAA